LIDEVKVDYKYKNKYNYNALHFAAQDNHWDLVAYLIDKKKLDINSRAKDNYRVSKYIRHRSILEFAA
jgi:ankyrin repeat protein